MFENIFVIQSSVAIVYGTRVRAPIAGSLLCSYSIQNPCMCSYNRQFTLVHLPPNSRLRVKWLPSCTMAVNFFGHTQNSSFIGFVTMT